ncbi:hypothetical protein ACI65C_005531 [Semiaphis heraclei]
MNVNPLVDATGGKICTSVVVASIIDLRTRNGVYNMLDLKDDDKDNKKGILVPSPYLKYGPQVQLSQSEYIFVDGVGSQQRGRFEMCFIDIGTWYSVGGTIGVIRGVHYGMKTILLDKQTGTYNRTL